MHSKLSLLARAAAVAGSIALAVPALAQTSETAPGTTKQSAGEATQTTPQKHAAKKQTQQTAEKSTAKKTEPATGEGAAK